MSDAVRSAKTWTMPDGIYTALITPFADGKVDRKAWRTLIERQLAAGVAGIVPVGCTGEAAVLSRDEREWLVREAVAMCRGRCAVVAGSGSNSTEVTIAQSRDVLAWGADAAMLISPYYNKPQQHGLVAHYRAVARAVDIPIVLYNVPGRTAVNILPETAAQLSAEPNIVALKEASGNLAQIEEAIARCDLKVFSGDDGLNFPIFGMGGRGAISVVSNLLPGAMVRFWNAWAAGDINRAWPMSRAFDPVTHACFVESNPVPVKELLSLAGICRRDPRLPLVPVGETSLSYLVQFYESTLADLMAHDLEGTA
jgi:4-hydroxy-tetrahydrodipicolinate synthase